MWKQYWYIYSSRERGDGRDKRYDERTDTQHKACGQTFNRAPSPTPWHLLISFRLPSSQAIYRKPFRHFTQPLSPHHPWKKMKRLFDLPSRVFIHFSVVTTLDMRLLFDSPMYFSDTKIIFLRFFFPPGSYCSGIPWKCQLVPVAYSIRHDDHQYLCSKHLRCDGV